MRAVFSSEFYKLCKRRGIWLIFLVTCLCGCVMGLISLTSVDIGEIPKETGIVEWVFIQGDNIYNVFFIITIVLSATFFALEYNDNTLKSVLFRGTSRVYVFLSKYILNVAMIFCLISIFVMSGSTAIGIRYGWTIVLTKKMLVNCIIFVERLSLIMATYASIYNMIGIVTKNLVLSIALSYGIRILEAIIVLCSRAIRNMDWIEKVIIANYNFYLNSFATKEFKCQMIWCVIIAALFMITSMIYFCKQDVKN